MSTAIRATGRWTLSVSSSFLLASSSPASLLSSTQITRDPAPVGEKGAVWSFNYFFHNKKLKRILYFSCRGRSKTAAGSLNTSTANTPSQQQDRTDEDEDGDEAGVDRYGMASGMDL